MWLRSMSVAEDEDRGDEVGLARSEVLFSFEVLPLEFRNGELGSGVVSGSGSGSESRI